MITAVSINQSIDGIFDPVLVMRSYGQEALLFESADIVSKLGEKSMLLLDLALKIEARDNHVYISAMLAEAQPLVKYLAHSFKNMLKDQGADSITLVFKPLYAQLDIIEKMRTPSALDVLRSILSVIKTNKPGAKETLMLGGVFAYDFLDHFEKLPPAKQDELGFPDYLFYLPLTVALIDHKKHQSSIIAHSLSPEPSLASERLKKALEHINQAMIKRAKPVNTSIGELDTKGFQRDISDADFEQLVARCKEHILAGDVYQIVPSRTFSREVSDPLSCYQALRTINPSPYMFYVRTNTWTLLGASPETFIKVDKQGSRVSVRPIAGTRRRGLDANGNIDEELDAREQVSLCLDEKELAEHMMLVDLARNDIASVSETGTRKIRRLLGVDRFSHVMHLVSEVEGILKDGYDALSAYQASMNMGTLMGAPKIRAAELLRELEHSKRGFYGGAVGYINKLGDMDTAIIIRSALVKNKRAYVRAGCGVVHDSNVKFETQETINKAEAVLKALETASRP